jgi:ferredoxin
MTIILLVLAIVFLVRRITVSHVRKSSSPADYVLILLVGILFSSGFGLVKGAPDIPVRIIHVLSGEVLLLVAIFLFVKSWLDETKCTGCAACEVECPTGTLTSQDEGTRRTFSYNHYQCILCGTCVHVCPEEAAGLRHVISLKRLFQVGLRDRIRTVDLALCRGCGEMITPQPQIEKVGKDFKNDFVRLCNNCKMKVTLEHMEGSKETAGQSEIRIPGFNRT